MRREYSTRCTRDADNCPYAFSSRRVVASEGFSDVFQHRVQSGGFSARAPNPRHPRRRRSARARGLPMCARRSSRAIFGQQEVIDQTLITLLSGGHVLLVGVPGLGKSRLVETLATRAGHGVEARPVHARPDAGRHSRQRGARRGRRRPPQLPFRARAGVLPVADGRRDQPRLAAHAVRAAPGDAGAARRGRRRGASAAPPVPCARDPESDRAGRHVSAAGSAARPIPARRSRCATRSGCRARDADRDHRDEPRPSRCRR